MGSLENLQKSLGKIKGTHISVMSQSEIASTREYLPTPSYDLNRILSGSLFKGLPNKTFSLFIGPEATGKSSFMCLCLAEAQRKGYTPVVIDTEGAWDTPFVKRWGLDAENMMYVYSPWIDSVMNTLAKLIESNEQKLAIVIDSIGGLERKKLYDDGIQGDIKADQGTLQKEIKRMLKMLLNICKAQESIALASGHYYGNSSGYGEADQIGGGKFTKLAPDIIVALKRYNLYENPNAASKKAKGKTVGSEVKAITLKNRFYPPFNEANIEIDYIKGVNKFAGMMTLGKDSGLIELNGAWYSFGTERLGQGAIKAEEELKNRPDIIEKLDEWLKTTCYSTINEEIREANEIIEDTEVLLDDEEVVNLKPNGKKITSKIKTKGE